ncbi:hypothetical protein ACMGDM_19240 [Sphingomonas sp. DT-51]|uniref:hypothetical protein n=1 Tax=Sphingomonas sp. DT-51 TaxID=3396165 RepID=UPI003F1ABE78
MTLVPVTTVAATRVQDGRLDIDALVFNAQQAAPALFHPNLNAGCMRMSASVCDRLARNRRCLCIYLRGEGPRLLPSSETLMDVSASPSRTRAAEEGDEVNVVAPAQPATRPCLPSAPAARSRSRA